MLLASFIGKLDLLLTLTKLVFALLALAIKTEMTANAFLIKFR